MRRTQFFLNGHRTKSAFRYVYFASATITNGNTTVSSTLPGGYTVDLANAWVTHLGQASPTGSAQGQDSKGAVQLTDAATVTVFRTGSTGSLTVYFVVRELEMGVLDGPVQQTTVALNGVTSNTAAISAVNTDYAELAPGGSVTNNTTGDFGETEGGLNLSNATTVGAAKGTGTGVLTLYFTVVPW